MHTLSNVRTRGGENNPPSIRLTSDTILEAISSKTGVSVEYVHDINKNWYVFRASYGREDVAADILIEDGTFAYIAKRYSEKIIKGKRRKVFQKLIPNILFAYTTKEKADEYVKYTPALSFLTYYYNHFERDNEMKNPPLTISCAEMENFIRATVSHNKHLLFVEPSQCHYKSGEIVKIIEGPFKGVEGKIARVAGQQRVIITISEIGLISTAYIPTAFIKKTDSNYQITNDE